MTEPTGPIIVPVDGVTFAGAATAFASRLAATRGADLELLYVVSEGPAELYDLPSNRTSDTDADRAARHQAGEEALLATRTHVVDAERVAVSTSVITDTSMTGDPGAVIADHARTRDARMIVMGTRGLSPLGKFLFDSVSDRILHKARCPVTVMPAAEACTGREPVARILVPLDGSARGDAAAQLAGAAAPGIGTRIELLAWPPNVDADVFSRRRVQLDRLGLTATEHRLEGSGPAEAILEHARIAPEDAWIIMGRRGLGPTRGQLLGSVSRAVLAAAPCPVTVVS